MTAPKLTPAQEAELCERSRDGETPMRVAEAFGVSMEALYEVLKRHGVPHQRRQSREQRAAILAAVESGASQNAVARQYDVPRSTVHLMIKRQREQEKSGP